MDHIDRQRHFPSSCFSKLTFYCVQCIYHQESDMLLLLSSTQSTYKTLFLLENIFRSLFKHLCQQKIKGWSNYKYEEEHQQIRVMVAVLDPYKSTWFAGSSDLVMIREPVWFDFATRICYASNQIAHRTSSATIIVTDPEPNVWFCFVLRRNQTETTMISSCDFSFRNLM